MRFNPEQHNPEGFSKERGEKQEGREEVFEMEPNTVIVHYNLENEDTEREERGGEKEKKEKKINSIEIETPNGSVDLVDLLPEEWHVVQADDLDIRGVNMEANFSTKKIRVRGEYSQKSLEWAGDDEEKLPEYEDESGGRKYVSGGFYKLEWKNDKAFSQPQHILTFLHEVAHARESPRRSLKESWLRSKVEQRKEADEEVIKTTKEAKDYHQLIIAEERRAWADALRIYRTYKQEGKDLLAGLGNKEILTTVRGFLEAYIHQTRPYYDRLSDTERRDWKERREGNIQKIINFLKGKLRESDGE